MPTASSRSSMTEACAALDLLPARSETVVASSRSYARAIASMVSCCGRPTRRCRYLPARQVATSRACDRKTNGCDRRTRGTSDRRPGMRRSSARLRPGRLILAAIQADCSGSIRTTDGRHRSARFDLMTYKLVRLPSLGMRSWTPQRALTGATDLAWSDGATPEGASVE